MKYRLPHVVFSLIMLCSCNGGDKVKLWEGYDCVIDRNGQVEKYEIQYGKPFVVTVMEMNSLYSVLGDTPEGKIDAIIEDNPDWEFVFYCGCQLAEVSEVRKILGDYDCNFPVIADPELNMWKANRLNGVEAISLVCDRDGDNLGGAVIGVIWSPFDSVFAKAKKMIPR